MACFCWLTADDVAVFLSVEVLLWQTLTVVEGRRLVFSGSQSPHITMGVEAIAQQ